MTFRSDIMIFWTLSPGLVFVAAPSTELTIQDLHDTLRVLEERSYQGLPYPQIIDTAGKEELGGGVQVGLTATLLNAKVAFEARKTSTVAGSITTTDSQGINLIDTSGNFIVNGVQSGSWVFNKTDGSKATVLRVISATQLQTDGLGDGADNTFTSGDLYEVQNVTQCEISGGNLVAVDTDGVTPIQAVLPTAGTQVVRTSASSATLQELQDIQHSSFNGGVTYKSSRCYSGTTYPVGTHRQPVNNLTNALSIANQRGFNTIYILDDATLNGSLDFRGFHIVGQGVTQTSVTVEANALVQGCEFYKCAISGTFDGEVFINDANVMNIGYTDGVIQDCALSGTITLSGSEDAHIINCWDGIAGSVSPIVNCGGTGSALNIRDYKGTLALTNKSGSDAISIDLVGRLVLDNTVTGGTITVRGIGEVVLNGATATVDTSNLVSPDNITSSVWSESKSSYTTPGTFGKEVASKTDVISTVIAFK